MHLKTLTLRGFKSFASATTLKFEPGITCVVGPNGSGKSNVVDALAWVMGEQGAKALRGGNMADVVFAGTSSRSALGRAEVSLTIDNSDGALPIDYTEVTISRTLFRSGGSEYAINGASCRLLDIQELLSDTGMGRQMHVIVGQGQLDAILHATPEERRGFIEEAAGVLKHRRRKDRALRKLETMAVNLARVEDLTAEIRRQLGPLARQADVARRAQVIQADARDARSRLYADDYAQLAAQLSAESANEGAIASKRREAETQVQRLRADLAAIEEASKTLQPRARQAADTVMALAGLRERLASVHALALDRSRFLGTPAPAFSGPDPEDLQAQAAAARESETALKSEEDEAHRELLTATEARTRAEDGERAAEQRVAAVHRGVADRREGLARFAGQVAARQSRVDAAHAERGRLASALSDAQRREAEAEAAYTALEAKIAADSDDGEDLEAVHERALTTAEEADAEAKRLAAAERAERGRADRARTQQETLALSLTRKDGTAQLAADEKVRALLPQTITVPEQWRTAVAAALGDYDEAGLTQTLTEALDAVRHAEDVDAGRVRILHGHRAENADVPADLTAACEIVGVKDDAYRPVVRAALGGVALAADLTEAEQILLHHPELRVATASGDVLDAVRLSGGGPGRTSHVELQARYDDAAAELADAEHKAAGLREQRTRADARAEEARRAVAASLSAVRSADAERARTNQKLAQLAATLRSAQAEVKRTGPSIEKLDEDLRGVEQELAGLRERLEVAEKEPQDAEADLAAAEGARTTAAEAASAARKAETDARLQLRTVQERVSALAGRAQQLFDAAAAEKASRERAQDRYRRRIAAAESADAIREDAAAALNAIGDSVRRAEQERAEAEAAQAEHQSETAGLRTAIDAATTRLSELTDAAHREELARAELKLRAESLAEKIRAELGVEPDTLVDEYGPHLPIVEMTSDADGNEAEVHRPYVRAEQEKRLKRAEKDVARLGKINPLALEEHAALNERHTFLTDQVADLKKSRSDLLTIIREIDERVERVFTDAFADTAKQFEQVFDRLFPGGEGRLVLTDPDDMLTTGIEVEARPAGKKVKRLSLLSGGERSLTAVAILVAIFKARPSPFYVMDEVEAALDDRNLDRLLGIFKELQNDSQLIVITHQKRTMEVADALYGVSMRDGVSAVISQRLETDQRD